MTFFWGTLFNKLIFISTCRIHACSTNTQLSHARTHTQTRWKLRTWSGEDLTSCPRNILTRPSSSRSVYDGLRVTVPRCWCHHDPHDFTFIHTQHVAWFRWEMKRKRGVLYTNLLSSRTSTRSRATHVGRWERPSWFSRAWASSSCSLPLLLWLRVWQGVVRTPVGWM